MNQPRSLILMAFAIAKVSLLFSTCFAREDAERRESGDSRPNILLILVDDLKPALGCYGDRHAKTPNIDALAKRGLRFENAYCNQAVCAPSRFTLMLGSHSTSTGLYGLGSQLREVMPQATTMPQYFERLAGYRTESLGKVFHIGHGNHGDPQSFSVPHFHEKVIEYADPNSTRGRLTREEAYFSNQRLGEIKSLPRGAAFEAPIVADAAYADGRVAREAKRRLEAAKRRLAADGTPFFMAVGFARPHLPFSVPKKYWDQFDPQTLPLPSSDELPKASPVVAGKRGGEITNYSPIPTERDSKFDQELIRRLIHGYYASTSYVDAQIGILLDELERLDLDKETIVVLWGDHGFHLGDLGIWTKHTNYEQANRIPILISAPGITRPGSVTKQIVETVDIYPTLSELAGLGDKPRVSQPIDGISMVPVLKNPTTRVRGHAYHAYPKRKLGRAIRTQRYRLVEWKSFRGDEPAEYELYDYQDGPVERENIAGERPEIVERLVRILKTYPNPVNREPATSKGLTPKISNQAVVVTGEVSDHKGDGVLVAQGGRECGFAIHIFENRVTFDVRINGKVSRIQASETINTRAIQFHASLDRHLMVLSVNGEVAAKQSSPGLIPAEPKDGVSVGRDDRTAAGRYNPPNVYRGKVRNVRINGRQVTM